MPIPKIIPPMTLDAEAKPRRGKGYRGSRPIILNISKKTIVTITWIAKYRSMLLLLNKKTSRNNLLRIKYCKI